VSGLDLIDNDNGKELNTAFFKFTSTILESFRSDYGPRKPVKMVIGMLGVDIGGKVRTISCDSTQTAYHDYRESR
jgi:hypothetical protein